MPTIICSECQAEDTVPFEPKDGSNVLCGDCFRKQKDAARANNSKYIPRKKHGTRVSFPIVCARCSAEETLDYVPKGTPLDQVLCSSCAQSRFGKDSSWAKIVEQKQVEAKTEWAFHCVECKRLDYMKTQPKPGREYYCQRCYYDHEEPTHERLEGKEKVGKESVFIRKRQKK